MSTRHSLQPSQMTSDACDERRRTACRSSRSWLGLGLGLGSYGELQGAMGSYRELWGAIGSYGEL